MAATTFISTTVLGMSWYVALAVLLGILLVLTLVMAWAAGMRAARAGRRGTER